MTIYRVHGDESGETRITTIDLPELDFQADGITQIRGFMNIPVSSVGLVEMVTVPDPYLHPAPARRLLVFLGGEMEIKATSGDRVVVRSGDVLLTDDVGSRGHYTTNVGSEPWTQLALSVDPSWRPRTA